MTYFVTFVSVVFGGAWRMLQTPVPVPGLAFTYADIFLATSIGFVGIAIVKGLAGAGVTMAGKSVKKKRAKISEERKKDTK